MTHSGAYVLLLACFLSLAYGYITPFIYVNRVFPTADCSGTATTTFYGGLDECAAGSGSSSAFVTVAGSYLIQMSYSSSATCSTTGVLAANVSVNRCFPPANTAFGLGQRVDVINSTLLTAIGIARYSDPDCTTITSGPNYSVFQPYVCTATNPTVIQRVTNHELSICQFNASDCNPQTSTVACRSIVAGACVNSTASPGVVWLKYYFTEIDSVDPYAPTAVPPVTGGEYNASTAAAPADCSTDLSLCALSSALIRSQPVSTFLFAMWTASAALIPLRRH